MKDKLSLLKNEARQEIVNSSTLQEIEDLRVKYLGKKGQLTEISKGMKNLSAEERPVIGQLLNEVRNEITEILEGKKIEITKELKAKQLEEEVIDITLAGKKTSQGSIHPISETADLLKKTFMDMGFDVADGPEVEYVKYNFDMLNIPESHPSRDITDTFYISDDVVLRTQTSPVQVRYMLEHKPPFRMVCPGKVYRPDYDVSHTPMFHQMEGLMIGENISFANLKAILTELVTKVFGDGTKVRFRPHFFPFTEPSAEMDVECVICKGKGCRVCKGSEWLEIMGCGMVDPAVLEAVGYKADEVSGFAFGVGIERITMLRHGIDDLRAFFENDMRFLKQFK